MILSTQWEYVFEAVAERPSIQDLIITPVVGSLLGEAIHRTTTRMRQNGTNILEKVFITLLNPAGAISSGY
jgi:multisubunit Na+/H+ antiporter MnhG subunit